MHRINIMKDFSRTPGSRFRVDGPHSGEDFRKTLLEPLFAERENSSKIEITLDGTEGYATSFLEEAFGGLARKYGKERCLERLVFVSNEDPLLIEEIKHYIKHCDE